MNANPKAVTFAADADGVGWIVFDDRASKANVLNEATRAGLASALDEAERGIAAGAARAVVIASGKERIFIAGADLKQLAALGSRENAEEFARAGQALFERIAELGVPVVAAIHGACAGGGFELALACDWRIASEAEVTQIGLPETSLGTIPGWGGTVRLPRLIGAKAALEHILGGRLMAASAARQGGMVDELAPSGELRTRAKEAALRLAADGGPARPVTATLAKEAAEEMRASVRRKAGAWNPALRAAIDAMEQTGGLRIADAFAVEARIFGEVTAGPVCKNLIRVFFLREAAKKRTLGGWFAQTERAAPIRKVGVIGAGVMGSGIAQWCAAKGFDVVLRDVAPGQVERGAAAARSLCEEAVRRGKMPREEAERTMGRIATTTEWDGFRECDVVIEAIVEDVAAKQTLWAEAARKVKPDTVLASNTSALPLEEIAREVANPERAVGLHFFNPVSRMPLVELVLARETSAETAERALSLVKALGKSAVICRSSPGFLVTRVLFFYLNAAVRLWEQGVKAETLDRAMREFGWPMGPLRLIDEVGVDVTDFIFGEMAHYFPERFEATRTCGRMVAAGAKGRKGGAGSGFYRDDGDDARVNEAIVREQRSGDMALGAEEIVSRLMGVMVGEAERCLAEGVVRSADDVDFALLSGAGFPAWRGGLLHWAKRQSSAAREE